jgi:hypothetical protein
MPEYYDSSRSPFSLAPPLGDGRGEGLLWSKPPSQRQAMFSDPPFRQAAVKTYAVAILFCGEQTEFPWSVADWSPSAP